MQKYQHLSLDLWGTLIRSNPSYAEKRNKLISNVFGINIHAENIRSGKALAEQLMETTGFQLTKYHIMGLILKDYLPASHKINFDDKVDKYYRLNSNLLLDYPPILLPGISEFIDKVTDVGVSINLLSNTSTIAGSDLDWFLDSKNLRQWFEACYYSDQFTHCKPHQKFYAKSSRHATSPDLILHVGDNPVTDNGGGILDCFIVSSTNPITNILNLI